MSRAPKTVPEHVPLVHLLRGGLVEGTGFKGVATRATLVGLAVFASRPYPIYVEATLRDALTKIYPHLAHGQTVTSNVKVIMKVITDARSPASALSGTDHRVAK